MAQATINSNSVEPLGFPNAGLGTEMGDTWNASVTKLNANFTELYGAFASGSVGTFQAGGSTGATGQFKPSGNLSKTVGPIGSSATNTTQTLASYTMPASLFNANGQELYITAWGTVAGNAAPKTIALNEGGAFVTTGTQTGSGYAWQLNGTYVRSGASTQNAFFSGVASGGIVTQKNQTDTSVETGTIAITCTCADASAAQSNVLLYGMTVTYYG